MFSFPDSPAWAATLIVTSYLTLTNLLLIWVSFGRAHWFWRVMALLPWPAAMLAAKMDDFAILAFMRTIVVLGGIWTIHAIAAARMNRGASLPAKQRFRLSIRGIMLITVVVGMCLATGQRLARPVSLIYGQLSLLLLWSTVAPFFIFSLQSVAAAWLAVGQRRVWAAFLFSAGVAAIAFEYGFEIPLLQSEVIPFHEGRISVAWLWMRGMIAVFPIVLPAVSYSLLRRSDTTRTSIWKHISAAACLVPAIAIIGWTAWRMLGPAPWLWEKDYPTPNAYQDYLSFTLEMTSSLPWNADEAAEREFLDKNADRLERLRPSLSLDSKVIPANDYHRGAEMIAHTVGKFELLAKGRPAHVQAEIGLDLLRFGTKTFVGGVWRHRMGAIGAINSGANLIYENRAALSADQCRTFGKEIGVLDKAREPLEKVLQRDYAWELQRWNVGEPDKLFLVTRSKSDSWGLRSTAWNSRLLWAIRDLGGVDSRALPPIPYKYDNASVSILRLLQVDLALQAFYKENHRWPQNLAELIPKYIEILPLDPTNNQPFHYRTSDQNYSLYGLAQDGVDRGGKIGMMDEVLLKSCDITLEMFQLENAKHQAYLAKLRAQGAATPPDK